MAQLNATKHTTENVRVTVSKRELLEGLWWELKESNPSLREYDHINGDDCMKWDGKDYHTNTDEYIAIRKATQRELDIHHAFENLKGFLDT